LGTNAATIVVASDFLDITVNFGQMWLPVTSLILL